MDYNDNIMKISEWLDSEKINYTIDDRSYYDGDEEVLYFYINKKLYKLRQDVIKIENNDYIYENIELYIKNDIIYEYENIIEYFKTIAF